MRMIKLILPPGEKFFAQSYSAFTWHCRPWRLERLNFFLAYPPCIHPIPFLFTRLHSRTERSGTSLLLRMPTHPAGDFKHFLVLNIQQQVNFPTSGHLRHFLVPNISPECTKMNEERLICKLDKYAFLTQIYPLLEI